MNFPDAVTVTVREQRSIDPDTGQPRTQDVDVCDLAPCAFSVLSAQQHSETWGNGSAPTSVATVAASLTLPAYGPQLDGELSAYTVRVSGWRGTWRIAAERPGRDWTTYLLTR